jgi:hypothetical protein
MPFQPDAMDAATLRKLAKRLQHAIRTHLAPDAGVPLNQAQAILAQTFAYPDWHAAVNAPRPGSGEPAASSPAKPLVSTDTRVSLQREGHSIQVPVRDLQVHDELSLDDATQYPRKATVSGHQIFNSLAHFPFPVVLPKNGMEQRWFLGFLERAWAVSEDRQNPHPFAFLLTCIAQAHAHFHAPLALEHAFRRAAEVIHRQGPLGFWAHLGDELAETHLTASVLAHELSQAGMANRQVAEAVLGAMAHGEGRDPGSPPPALTWVAEGGLLGPPAAGSESPRAQTLWARPERAQPFLDLIEYAQASGSNTLGQVLYDSAERNDDDGDGRLYAIGLQAEERQGQPVWQTLAADSWRTAPVFALLTVALKREDEGTPSLEGLQLAARYGSATAVPWPMAWRPRCPPRPGSDDCGHDLWHDLPAEEQDAFLSELASHASTDSLESALEEALRSFRTLQMPHLAVYTALSLARLHRLEGDEAAWGQDLAQDLKQVAPRLALDFLKAGRSRVMEGLHAILPRLEVHRSTGKWASSAALSMTSGIAQLQSTSSRDRLRRRPSP